MVKKRTVVVTRVIPYATKRVNAPSLAKGITEVRIRGVTGVKTLMYEVTLTDGVQTRKRLVRAVVTKRPVTRVIAIGAKSTRQCDPNYSGACVPIAGDVDCAGGITKKPTLPGRAAARLLLDAGHRGGIHLIGAGPGIRNVPAGAVAAVERLTGIREVLGAAGVKMASGRICRDWQPEYGLAATRALLENERPRALICFNDRLALGAYQALDDSRLKVPADVSVVSFDDHPIAAWIRPKLTTVALPHYELGRKAVDVLFVEMDRQGEDADREGEVHRVPMPVRARESVAPPGA